MGFHGVNIDEVATMALGLVIMPEVLPRKIITCAAALMTVQAPFMLMALVAVIAGLAGQNSVAADEISIMIG